jgi:hypothetical protein
VLPVVSIPGMADDGGLDASIIAPKAALATAKAAAEITVRRVLVRLLLEMVFPQFVVSGHWHDEDPQLRVFVITVGSAPHDSPGGSMKVL